MTRATAESVRLKHFRGSKSVIGRFVARRSMRGATFWAAVFGLFVATKSIGYAAAYPTAHSRQQLIASFANNIGLKALLGVPHELNHVAGFAAWNSAGGIIIIGSIWAFLLATKNLRGEEDNGRWEILLSGQTTARRATLNVLAGLGATLTVFYVIMAVIFIAVGQVHKVDYSSSSALFYALTILLVVALFMAIGALSSQLMPTRSRAASTAAAIFGAAFLVRAVADTTSAAWLLNFTPLGWAEKAQPLAGSHGVWLIPLAALVFILVGLTIYLAGQRDLGESIVADKDSAEPHNALLGAALPAGLRLSRTSIIGWLSGIALVTFFFGLLTKSAAQAFGDSVKAQQRINHITHSTQTFGVDTFLSVVFFLAMTLIMAYAASALGVVREEEANGRLDNFLVRSVSRVGWLGGRLLLVLAVSISAGLLSGLMVWLGVISQNAGISFHTLLLSGINAITPAILVVGLGTFALGFVSRLTSLVAYAVIAWSFLLDIVSSGINLNHWILDTSIFQHVILAPAANPDWGRDSVIVAIAIILACLGALRFNHRDLQSE